MKTVLFNGKVYVEKGVYAQAVLIEDGIISAVGTDKEILAKAELIDDADASGGFEKIDCEGRTVIPGLNDSHMHLLSFGRTLQKAKIDDVKSIDHMIERCRQFIEKHPDRVVNGMHALGWNQDTFTEGEKRMPTRHDLDKISTNIPVIMERVCGHMLSANTKAIEILGYDKEVPEIPGGEIRLEEDGFPSGIFTENACFVVNELIPTPDKAERQAALLEGMKYAVAYGLTSIQANDVGYPECKGAGAFETYSELYERGEALLRFRHQNLFDSPEEFEEYLVSGEGAKGSYPESALGFGKDPWLTLGPLKLYKDGSLGARTAMVKDGYLDGPDNFGVSCIEPEEMDRYCKIASEHGIQVVTHTIGDLAMNETLDSYEKAFINGENKLRHALIHCQVTDNDLIDRIIDKDILVMAQPIFMGSDMDVMQQIFKDELTETCLAFGTLLKRGAHLSYGTDCPVEDCNPFWNLHQAVNRVDINNKPEGGFYPKECVDVETAIDAYTYESAYCEFMEDVKGRIKPGYYADVVVLDTDIFTCDPLTIKDILPVMTMVGGRVVYEK
ncbi:MAG: amidohydrolase [Firmicutes bacterium]|nr:amidohydrolase [Bacillota bacterium]